MRIPAILQIREAATRGKRKFVFVVQLTEQFVLRARDLCPLKGIYYKEDLAI